MKVTCIANRGKDLLPESLEIRNSKTEYHLQIGKLYVVYGISLWRGRLSYLVSDAPHDSPNWYPIELFKIVDHSLPSNWHFNFYGYGEKHFLNALWGYEELLNLDHYDNILEREGKDLLLFFKRKQEINLDENFRDYLNTLTCEGQAKVKNKEYVIQKIFDLKNVNFVELIFFGMARGFIDNDFVVDFAMKALEYERLAQKTLWLEIAGLLKNEYDQAPTLIEQAIKNKQNVLTEQSSLYNRIWFYLSLAADMSTDKIIE